MSDQESRAPGPPDGPQRREVEARLTRTLVAMFSAGELHTFIRQQVSVELADELPEPTHLSRKAFAARVAEKVVDHELVEKFETALQAKRTERASARGSDETARSRAQSEPRYENAEVRELSNRLQEAEARKARLQAAEADTAEVTDEILDLERRLRQGGQVQAGDTLGDARYLVLEKLGRGGFSTVWKALDQQAGSEVAIKVLHSNLAIEPIRRDRLIRGARIMSELAHPGMIRILEPPAEDAGYHYFVMELATGGTLHDAVLEGRVSSEECVPLIIGLGRALAAAHQRGHASVFLQGSGPDAWRLQP